MVPINKKLSSRQRVQRIQNNFRTEKESCSSSIKRKPNWKHMKRPATVIQWTHNKY